MRLKVLIIIFMSSLSSGDLLADDPLDLLTGTEEWDREEEAKKRALVEAERRRLVSEEYEKARSSFSILLSEWQRDLSFFQKTKRMVEDILFHEEAEGYQQVNVREKMPPGGVKHIKAKPPGVSIEAGGPIIEGGRESPPSGGSGLPTEAVIRSPSGIGGVPTLQPGKREPPEPTAEEILKKQQGYFDEKGQFIDEELKGEVGGKGEKNKDIDYDSP